MGNRISQAKDITNLSNVIDKAIQSTENELSTELERFKIDLTKELKPPQIAWQQKNLKTDGYTTLGTLGNFGLVIGKAKARKTFYINIAISTAVSKALILGRFLSSLEPDKSEVLYFDNEQAEYHVQLVARRICKQINISLPPNLHVYHLRSLTPQERLKLIEYAIYSNKKVGFVIIDGIKDLVTAINDEEQATMITSKLLKWTEERNIYILTVLHQNKGDLNARGHLGTELINKAETVLSITKVENNPDISIVEPQQCRNIEPEIFAFQIIDGLPAIVEGFEPSIKKISNSFSVKDIEDHKKYQLLTEVFSHGNGFKYNELTSQLKIAYKNQLQKDLGNNKIGDLITYCKNKEWLIQKVKGQHYTLGNFTALEL